MDKSSSPFIIPPKKNKAIVIVQPNPASNTEISSASSAPSSRDLTQKSKKAKAEAKTVQSTNGLLARHEFYDGAAQIPGNTQTSSVISKTRLIENTAAISRTQTSGEENSDVKQQLSKTGSKHVSSLDIYAARYVPYWLRAINHSPCTAVAQAPVLRHLDYAEYIKHFAGAAFLNTIYHVHLPTNICGISHKNVYAEIYSAFWRERLQLDMGLRSRADGAYSLFNTKLDIQDAALSLYALKVAGIREHTPRIDLGDIIRLRQIRADVAGDIGARSANWNGHGLAPGFTGYEWRAVVTAVLRRRETIVLRTEPTFSPMYSYNVIFPLQAHKYAPAWRAVDRIGSVVSTTHKITNPWATSMLFPEESDGVQQAQLSRGTFNLKWKDDSLNFEQKRAVQAVVDAKYGRIPYLVSGPPGTGKTKTLVETALQLLANSPGSRAHILVCAPSDSAADILVVRLAEHLSPRELFRLNSWMRPFAEIPDRVIPYTYVDDDQLFSMPDFKTMMEFRIVVTTCREADMLEQARLTNEALSVITSQMLHMVAPSISLNPVDLLHWTCLLLDEAAQATEPETLIPINVVLPPIINGEMAGLPQVVMAGDEHQLGPRVFNTNMYEEITADNRLHANGLEKSLFERLFMRDIYALHPLSRSNGLRTLTSALLPIIRPPFTNLIRNYRSHPAILSIPSSLFYADTLIPEQTRALDTIFSWYRWPSPYKWPIIFHHNDSADAVESILEGDGTGAGSLSNQGEAMIALEMVQDLLSHCNDKYITTLRPVDIIVMSPFRAQVNHLRNVFRAANLHTINIGPLEAFQGLEGRVVILCTTRTRLGNGSNGAAKFVEEDKQRNLGIVNEPRRFNVAITRAKEALLVIGNAETLTCTRDSCWLAFLEFCQRNSLFTKRTPWAGKGFGRPTGKAGGDIGKLESALNYAEAVQRNEQAYTARSIFCNEHNYMGIGRGSGLAMPKKETQQEGFKFKLKGTLIDLNEEMWHNVGYNEHAQYDEEEDGEEYSGESN